MRRKYREIYYFAEKGECDFVAFHKGSAAEFVQACFHLNPDNIERELSGLIEALDFFKMKEGFVVTYNQKDNFEKNGKIIKALPYNEWIGLL